MPKAELAPLDPRAFWLSAFRGLPDGSGRQYSATTFEPDPLRTFGHLLRMARAVGFVRPCDEDPEGAYAVLDVQDEAGEIVQDYLIPTAAAFRWWYRKLHLRVETHG